VIVISILSDFIEKNDKLITVFGVFGAIVAFSLSIGDTFIIFCSLAFFLLLSWELQTKVKQFEAQLKRSEENSNSLLSAFSIFSAVLASFVLAVYLYTAKYAYTHSQGLTFSLGFIFIPCLCFLMLIVENWKKNTEIKVLWDKTLWDKIFYFRIILIVLSLVLSFEISYSLTKVFEYVYIR
jgi:uncharacterized membrane protein